MKPRTGGRSPRALAVALVCFAYVALRVYLNRFYPGPGEAPYIDWIVIAVFTLLGTASAFGHRWPHWIALIFSCLQCLLAYVIVFATGGVALLMAFVEKNWALQLLSPVVLFVVLCGLFFVPASPRRDLQPAGAVRRIS